MKNIATFTEQEIYEASDPESRTELFRSRGLPMRENGTMDTDNFTILQKRVVTYEYKWAPIEDVFIRAVNGPRSMARDDH